MPQMREGIGMNNWISVEDRLPPDGQECLALYVFNNIARTKIIAYLLDGLWHMCYGFVSYEFHSNLQKITHWMELPEYPQ
jgi:hypothetical protein